jgi:hypothetical protein
MLEQLLLRLMLLEQMLLQTFAGKGVGCTNVVGTIDVRAIVVRTNFKPKPILNQMLLLEQKLFEQIFLDQMSL